MSDAFMVVKTAFPPTDLDDVLELVADPDAGPALYREIAERIVGAVVWKGDGGIAQSDLGEVSAEPTEASLLLNFAVPLSDDSAGILAQRALSAGAALLDVTTGEVVSPA